MQQMWELLVDCVLQRFTSESLAKVFFFFFFGNFAENSAENSQKFLLLRQERVRKFCGKFAEISRTNFCKDPFPNDPTSELLSAEHASISGFACRALLRMSVLGL